MPYESKPGRARLTGSNAAQTDINQPWEQDNQAWWDWYVSLGDNQIDAARPIDADAADAADALLENELRDCDLASDSELEVQLAAAYPLTSDHCRLFRANGHIKLPGVLSRPAVRRLRAEMLRCFEDEFGTDPDRGIADRFISVEMAWLNNPVIRRYVLSPRIGRLSAELLGVDATRLYHDNLLAKQPGCGRTPWHYDRHHFPLATDDIVTAWIPAQTISPAMGPLTFAGPIETYRHVENIDFDKFGTSYDRRVDDIFRKHLNLIHIKEEPFSIGDVSFHHNLCFHSAGANRTRFSRIALANTYFADGARVVDRPTMVSGDWQKFMPGVAAGEIVNSEYNPICWFRKD